MTRLNAIYGGINLSQGFPDFPAPEALKEAAVKAIRDDINQYAVTWGEQELRAAVAQGARAIIINNPNNPTGRVLTRQELQFLADLCIQHDALAYTDEIYEHILYDGREHISLATLPGMFERTITISGVSKTYSV